MWECPECGRKFKRNKQSHSCEQYSFEAIFLGKEDGVRNLFNELAERLKAFGGIDLYTGRTHLTIRRLSTFLSVLVEKDHLTLVFITDKPVEEFPVYQNYHYSQHRYANAVKVESLDEIDDQLMGWLHQAWELAG